MRTSSSALCALAVALASAGARAQEAAPRFSLVTGETVSSGANMIGGLFGWPGFALDWQHGLGERADAGLSLAALYTVEGTTSTSFGIDLAAPLRILVARAGRTSLMLRIAPGLTFYATQPKGTLGFAFPVAAVVGFQVAPDARLALGADLGMKVAPWTNGGSATFELAPEAGPAFEYYVDRQLSVGVDARFGPVVSFGGGTTSAFGFRAQLTVAYRL